MNAEVLPMPTIQSAEKRGGGMLFYAAIFVLGIVGAYAISLYMTGNSLKKEIEDQQTSIAFIGNAIKELGNTDNVSDKLVAGQIMSKIDAQRTSWNPMVESLMDLEAEGVKFVSFGSGRDNAVTITGQASSYAQVGDLLLQIDASPILQGVFVDSAVSQKQTTRNAVGSTSTQNFVQFQLRFDYSPEKIQ